MFEDFNEVICLGMGGSYSEIAKDRLFKTYDLSTLFKWDKRMYRIR